jgi:beta-glucosidase-like glycosyl hydrolase
MVADICGSVRRKDAMSTPSSAREALIAELMGEVSSLLDRVDALVPALNATCDILHRARTDVDARAAQAERSIAALTEAAKTNAVRHIARRTEELARCSAETQTSAMQVARQVLRTELAHALGQLKLMFGFRRQWWSHAATAASSSLVTAALIKYLLTS